MCLSKFWNKWSIERRKETDTAIGQCHLFLATESRLHSAFYLVVSIDHVH